VNSEWRMEIELQMELLQHLLPCLKMLSQTHLDTG